MNNKQKYRKQWGKRKSGIVRRCLTCGRFIAIRNEQIKTQKFCSIESGRRCWDIYRKSHPTTNGPRDKPRTKKRIQQIREYCNEPKQCRKYHCTSIWDEEKDNKLNCFGRFYTGECYEGPGNI